VAHEHGLLLAELVEQGDEITAEMQDVVLVDPSGADVRPYPRWSGAIAR
jgi:hypothetical protein